MHLSFCFCLTFFINYSYFDFYFTIYLSYIYHLLADFKKASNEDKLSLFSSLLKGYQEEVDNLTKRAKYGENAFLNIYQKLYEAPDPYPVIASIAVSSSLAFHMITFLTELWSNSILIMHVNYYLCC